MPSSVKYLAAAAALCAALWAPNARAADPAFVTVGVGVFDFLHHQQAADFRFEFRADRVGFFEPVAGVETTSDGAYYIYGGFNIDILLGRRWVLSPGFDVGHFSPGSGKVLGAKLEYHSGAELAYRFDDRSRLGIALHHISNAGLTKHNPGTEIISITYSYPIGRIFTDK